jgi:magnesium transporter
MVEKRPSDETAELMACLSRPEAGRVAQALVASDRASGPLARLSQPLLRDVLTFLSPSELGRLIGASALDLEQAVLYFSLVPVERQPLVLDELSAERRAHVKRMLHYPEDSAGALMTTAVFTMAETDSVQQAIEKFQRSQEELEAGFYLHVVDDTGRLMGVLSLRQLILCSPQRLLGECVGEQPVAVDALASRNDLAAVVDHYGFLSVPVSDDSGCLLGAVTVDRVIDVLPSQDDAATARCATPPLPATPQPRWQALRSLLSSTILKFGTSFMAALAVTLLA